MSGIALLLKALSLGKIVPSLASMLISVAVYAAMWGWRFAAGFVALLLLHELGHCAAARDRGVEVTAPMFIPFVGAYVMLRERPRDAETEAHIALGGPLVGALSAFAVYFLGRAQDSVLLAAIAYSGFLLNLVNLIPVRPLDGGRIVEVLGPRIWLLGLPVLVIAFIHFPNPFFISVAAAAAPEVVDTLLSGPLSEADARYYAIGGSTKIGYGVLYLALVVLLGMMTWSLDEELAASRYGFH